MPRLLTPPEIDWREDGTPVARAHNDVYFTAGDGLAESRAVFLAGCGLPDAWQGREVFTVAETGFGTGLNFLALWQMWETHRPSPTARLHFVSFEAFPLLPQDAVRALDSWPELEELAALMIARWPGPAKGVRRMVWPDAGVSLTLHHGDIRETLPAARFRADAWFLDGFSPAKNEEMWGDWIYPEIAARSVPGARLATFTWPRPGSTSVASRAMAASASGSKPPLPPPCHPLPIPMPPSRQHPACDVSPSLAQALPGPVPPARWWMPGPTSPYSTAAKIRHPAPAAIRWPC